MRTSQFAFGAAVGALVALISGCGQPGIVEVTEGLREVSGSYLLEAVDGQGIPAVLALDDDCVPTVVQGELGVNTPRGLTLPLYTWYASALERCGQSTARGVRIGDDFGSWSREGTSMHFSSRKSRGNYTGEINVGPPLRLTIDDGEHTYTFRQARREGDPHGLVAVQAVDQFDAPVAGVALIFRTPDGIPAGGTTPSSGSFMTSGSPGTWGLTVTPPAGHVVPEHQPNPIEFTVTADEITQIRFELERLPGG